MRAPSLFGPAAAGISTVLKIWSLVSIIRPTTVDAFSFTPVLHPDLDLSPLGRVALAGDFDAVSIYSYKEQSENNAVDNNIQSLLTPLPNGILTALSKSDAHILAMCLFTQKDGTYSGIFVGGNFTSLGGVESQGIALFNTSSGAITALPGLSGSVSALLCDQETNSVYVGGDFKYGNTSNAVAWVGDDGFSALSFGGFNGPVTSIMKADDGHIIFGGSFDGLGNTTTSSKQHEQIINLQDSTVTSDAESDTEGYIDPRNIICQTSGEDAEGKTWLLADNSPGFWRAEMGFGYRPTRLRLYNTHLDGRGTKTFLFRALPDNGIMNLTYTDPETGDDVYCDRTCSLSSDPGETYREFKFVNNIGMSGFQIEISDWFGAGAGLNGIELFQSEIYAYAIDGFNEPTCASLRNPSRSTRTGSWTVAASGQSQSGYLTTQVTDFNATSASVTFEPDIKESGNYTVTLYTPGCTEDGTCASRGIVNVTGLFATRTDSAASVETLIYQTNNYEKYDTIYTGYVDASSSSFRPNVRLTPLADQGDITVVASRVRFEKLSSTTGGLNGLYEHDPTSTNTTVDLSQSVVNEAGTQLDTGASILSLAKHDRVIYAGGNFSDSEINNIMFFTDGNATTMPKGGLNAEVDSMLVQGDFLYVGGSFTDTSAGGDDQLQHVAAYSLTSKSWSSLGAGVNGRVRSLLTMPLNVSTEINETTIAVSGDFDQILAFDNNTSIVVSGFAVWVPSQKNWLQNLNVSQMNFDGQLTAVATVNDTAILAGSLNSDGIAASDAVSLLHSDALSLDSMSIRTGKANESSGMYTGIFDTSAGRNLTILGGHFTTTASNGSSVENLLILNGTDQTVAGLPTGVDSNSTFLTLAVTSNTLYAGGNVTGTVGGSELNGVVVYNLASQSFVKPQPPPLTGPNVSVNSIVVRPDSSEIYFGGSFDAAGSLPCPSVCFWDLSEGQWNRPGVSLTGTILALKWASSNVLFAVGNLTVSNNQTAVATYNPKAQSWSSLEGASPSSIPGTVTAFAAASEDISKFWLAGQSTNGSSFLMNYDGSKFQSAGNIFGDGTTIRGLEVLVTSSKHDSTAFFRDDQVLLVTGQLVIPDFGNASAAVYNGSVLTPFILSSTSDGKPGSISQIFTENENTYSKNSSHHSNGIIVLISFCLALACVFLIVAFGIILNKIQRRRQGYMAAPQTYGTDRPTSMSRVPPEYLFNTLSNRNPGAPVI